MLLFSVLWKDDFVLFPFHVCRYVYILRWVQATTCVCSCKCMQIQIETCGECSVSFSITLLPYLLKHGLNFRLCLYDVASLLSLGMPRLPLLDWNYRWTIMPTQHLCMFYSSVFLSLLLPGFWSTVRKALFQFVVFRNLSLSWQGKYSGKSYSVPLSRSISLMLTYPCNKQEAKWDGKPEGLLQ